MHVHGGKVRGVELVVLIFLVLVFITKNTDLSLELILKNFPGINFFLPEEMVAMFSL